MMKIPYVADVVVGLVVALGVHGEARAFDGASIASPNGQVRLRVLDHEGRVGFAVTLRDSAVIEASPMSVMVDGVDIAEGVEGGTIERYRTDETYPWRGGRSVAVDRSEGARISLRHVESGTGYTVEVRAYDDGVAFRTIVPGGEGTRAVDERTRFVIPAGSVVWYHDLGGHYEGTYETKEIAEVKAEEWAAPPVTFKLPGGAGYGSMTEGALANYSGMALEGDGERGFVVGLGHRQPLNYPFRLRYGEDEHKRLSEPAALSGTITTPWRVVMVGGDLNALVNCDILHNLCPPADPKLFPRGMATEWLKPGRAVWKYLDGGQSTLEEMRAFCDWAGELGFEHHVIEGFWRRWSDDELKELADYARERNVGLWLWRHTRELRTPEARREFFKRCQDAGAVGVKLDFLDHEAKEVVDLYAVLLREAAEHKLMVNFHGANKPTGEARTWPNELTREAVRGMESSRLTERARHNTILPFTRFLAGHADYTPVHFGARRGDTTWAHQIATAAIFDSPLLTYGAHPKKLLDNPAVEMIKSIPAVWDETIVLPGSEIGEMAGFARRSGDRWFVAVLNGPAARKVEIGLSFLGDGKYEGLLVRDGEEAEAVRVERSPAARGDVMAMELGAGGGFVGRFSPVAGGR